MFPEDVVRLAEALVAGAQARGLMLATAESCTGGLLAGAITAIPGSSAVLERGFVTYSNAAKSELLGVSPELLADHGAVSGPVARAMAQGAARAAGVSLAVSITGVAGPGGGSAEKPVGLVHFGCTGPRGSVHQEHRFGDRGRDRIRLESVRVALALLLDQLA